MLWVGGQSNDGLYADSRGHVLLDITHYFGGSYLGWPKGRLGLVYTEGGVGPPLSLGGALRK